MGKINLSKEESLRQIDLRKSEVSKICLDKPILSGTKSRVALVLDYSGSMSNLYHDGSVQAVIEKILPLAMNFDDNGEMELWIFEDGFHRLDNITLENYYGYVDNYILPKYNMGCTQFAPVMSDIKSRYIIEEPQNIPNYIIFITDGENSDTYRTTEMLKDLSNYPIFFQFVGIGNCRFEYLQNLDDMQGRYVDNADFFAIKDINSITYEQLLNEYPQWLCEQKVTDMIAAQGTHEVLGTADDTKGKKTGLFGRIFKSKA